MYILRKHIPQMIRLLFFLLTISISAQNTLKENQLKMNTVFIPIGIINAGMEFSLSSQFTIQGDVFISPWKSIVNHRALVAMGHIEGRYYLRERYDGWYAGIHVGGGVFELTKWNYTGTNKFQRGFNFMVGGTIGYQWDISYRWGLDFYLGGGTVQSFYKGYDQLPGKFITRYEKSSPWNKSGEFLPYRGGIMLTYKLK